MLQKQRQQKHSWSEHNHQQKANKIIGFYSEKSNMLEEAQRISSFSVYF